MNQGFVRFLRVLYLALDFLMLNLILLLIRDIFFLLKSVPVPNEFLKYCGLINIAWFFSSWLMGTYDDDVITAFELFARRTMRVFILWLGIVLSFILITRYPQLSRSVILSSFAGFASVLLFNRLIYLPLLHLLNKSENLQKNVLIIGYNSVAKKLAEGITGYSSHIIGFCDNADKVKELSLFPIISDVNNVMDISRQYHVNEIYCTILPESFPRIYEVMKQADQECIRFRLVPDLDSFIKRPMHLGYINNIPILFPRSEPLEEYSNWIRKRAFDVIISSLVIIFILSWLIPFVGLLIRLESKGPVFFVQMRSGRNNKPFPCIKFRSMEVNNYADSKQASKNDNRVTKTGRFLRKTSLDEFPQFLNVFRGEMSLVGPRPHMIKHTEDYSRLIGQYMIRQFLRPGLTGWAQVNGLRGETQTLEDMKQRVEYDIWYMENWGLWLDIRIILRTVFNIFKGEEKAF